MAAGSHCRTQTPAPGPAAVHAKPWLSSGSLDAMQIPWAPRHSFGSQGRSGTCAAAAHREPRQRALLALPFGGLPGSPRRAARWLCPQPLPPPPPLPPRAGSGSPARCAPPPGARPRPQAPGPSPPRWPATVPTLPASRVCAGPAAPQAEQLQLLRVLMHPVGQDAPSVKGTPPQQTRCLEMTSKVHDQATSASTESLLEKQISGPHPRSTESESLGMRPSNEYFNKLLGGIPSTLKLEKHCALCLGTRGLIKCSSETQEPTRAEGLTWQLLQSQRIRRLCLGYRSSCFIDSEVFRDKQRGENIYF